MLGKWEVTSQYIGDVRMYAVYRLRNAADVDHSGNREYTTGYMADEAEATAVAERLNRQND